METKRAFDYLRMPKPQAIFTRVAIVCRQYETLAVLQNVFAIILLWARKDVEKLFNNKMVILARHCLMTGLYFEPWVIVVFLIHTLCTEWSNN